MKSRLACLIASALSATALTTISASVAQAATAAAPYKVPHNEFGQPELAGTWANTMLTKLERPAEYGDRLVLNQDEVDKLEGERVAMRKSGDEPTPQNATADDLTRVCNIPGQKAGTPDCGVPTAWIDAGEQVSRVNGQPRSSLMTFPADGKIPYKPGIREAMGKRGAIIRVLADNPENRSLADRCIVGQNTFQGYVITPSLYNNTFVIQQSPDTAVIVLEMSHEPRMIKLNARHGNVPRWYGDSIGHYEGDTLVAETTNFMPEQRGANNSDALKVTERFTRVGPGRILYQFKVEDPAAYTQAWGGEYEFHTGSSQYEYACHEGNYGLIGILQGARADERNGKAPTAMAATPAKNASVEDRGE